MSWLGDIVDVVRSGDDERVDREGRRLRERLRETIEGWRGRRKIRGLERRYEETNSWEDGKDLLVGMVKWRVGPSRVGSDVLWKALRVGTEDTKKCVDYLGHGIAVNVWKARRAKIAADPSIVVELQRRTEGRIVEDGRDLCISIRLLFGERDLPPSLWRSSAAEIGELLSTTLINGKYGTWNVRVRKSYVPGYVEMVCVSRLNLPMLCILVRELMKVW